MRTLLCCIGRKENAYIREFIEHYKKIGFTNIVLYDNNRDGEDDFNDVISDYINDGYVILKDYRNKSLCQTDAYQECYDEYGKDYDWVAFFDCDEFLELPKDGNIEAYLSRDCFKEVEKIHINWMTFGDSGEVELREGGVQERFANPVPYDMCKAYKFPENNHIKTILRTGHKIVWNKYIPHTPHVCDSESTSNADGLALANQDRPFVAYTFENAYLKHYTTKSTREFCNKMKRGFPDIEEETWQERRQDIAKAYFTINTPTKEKIQMFKEELGFDFSDLLPKEPVKIEPIEQIEYTGEKSKDVQIFSLCFTKKDYQFMDNKYVTPLQVGADSTRLDVCKLKDNTGEHISGLNFFFIENTGLYWIWRNVKDAKYKGQMQYRRPLEGINDDTDFEDIFSKYDVITCEPFHHPDHKTPRFEGDPVIVADTVEEGYAFSNCIDDIGIVEMVIKLYFPEYAEDWDKYIKKGEDLYYSNGFIMRSEEYDKYCDFLFKVLNGYLTMANIHSYDDLINHVKYNLETGKYIRYPNNRYGEADIQYQSRIGGYLSERIWTLWLLHNYPKDRIYTKDYAKQEENQWI